MSSLRPAYHNATSNGTTTNRLFGLENHPARSHLAKSRPPDRARDQGLPTEQLPRLSLVQRAEIPRPFLAGSAPVRAADALHRVRITTSRPGHSDSENCRMARMTRS